MVGKPRVSLVGVRGVRVLGCLGNVQQIGELRERPLPCKIQQMKYKQGL